MSDLERALLTLLKQHHLPAPQQEWKFLSDRRFRFDFAYPEGKIGIEVQGGAWVQGRHSQGAGFIRDCEKFSLAALNGWLLLLVTSEHIGSGKAVEWIRDALELRQVAA